ncbi:hypothetical protein M405DRAFT_890507 [Rhizopogon salebrosus TDB-379]|nr:hypothetical protein M405DRAFT_890507 [Rhizopogon salebrosus TDB-379]
MQWDSPPPNPQSNPTPPSSLQNTKPRAKPPAKQTPPTSSAKTDVWIFVAQCNPHVGDSPGLVTPEASEGRKEQRHRWYHGVDRARGCESPSPPYPHIDLMKRQGVPANKERLNLALLGNPTTGKPTVARLYAQFLESKVLPGDTFLEAMGSSLVDDGVAGAKNSLGMQRQLEEVLDFLAEMENQVSSLLFVLAGYNKQMEKFFEHNPGLPSRILYSIKFADYTDAELLTMLEALVEKRYSGQMKVEDGIRGLYARISIPRLDRGRGREGFGNAWELQNTFSWVAQRQAEQLEKERKQSWITHDFMLTKEDLIGPDHPRSLRSALLAPQYSENQYLAGPTADGVVQQSRPASAPTGSGSSTAGGSQPPKPPSQKNSSSNKPPPQPPSQPPSQNQSSSKMPPPKPPSQPWSSTSSGS